MADTKITALTALTAADPANDVIPIVDVSDTSMAASGTTKKISVNNILSSSPTASGALTVTGLVTAGSASITGAATVGTTLGVTGVSTLASATITGALTVDTTTLVVDATNNRVGIGTATPASGYSLDILGAAVGGIRVSSNNYPNLVIDSANSNGALIYIQEGGTTQARIGHLTTVTGLEFSGNNGTAATNVHYGIDATGISTWKNVGGVAGTAMTLNSTGLGIKGTIGTSSGDAVIAFGTRGVIVGNSGSAIASASYIDVTVITSGAGYQGFLSVANSQDASANVRTQTTYSVFGRGTSSTITQIATANGSSGGASFTVTTPSNGVIRITNTSGLDATISAQFFGGASL